MFSSQSEILILHGQIGGYQVTCNDFCEPIGKCAELERDGLIELIRLDLIGDMRLSDPFGALRTLVAFVPIICPPRRT